MAVKTIKLPPSAYQTMVTHAFTHEKEEIAGLIIGEVASDYIQIYAVIPLQRINQKLDRVEVSSEQLLGGMEKAEEISKELNKKMQILGWYHSHPHITVYPSHIDLATQYNFQMMEANFFGLILSVFVTESDKLSQSIELIAFRSGPKQEAIYPDLLVEPIKNLTVDPEAIYSVSIKSWKAVSECAEEEIMSELKSGDQTDKVLIAKTLKFIELLDSLRKPMISCARYMTIGMDIYTANN